MSDSNTEHKGPFPPWLNLTTLVAIASMLGNAGQAYFTNQQKQHESELKMELVQTLNDLQRNLLKEVRDNFALRSEFTVLERRVDRLEEHENYARTR